MKKFFGLILSVVLVLSLAACSGETTTTDKTASAPNVVETAPASDVVEAVETPKQEQKLVIELVAGVQGEYGTPITFNKGTEFEDTVIAYHIPAGEYTATNTGKYMTQFNIYSDEIHKTEAGWEEPAETLFVKLVDAGATVDFTITDGQYIKIVEPAKFKIEQK